MPLILRTQQRTAQLVVTLMLLPHTSGGWFDYCGNLEAGNLAMDCSDGGRDADSTMIVSLNN